MRQGRFRSVVLGAGLLLAVAAPALAAEPVVTVNTVYYEVSGRTGADLKREMKRKGPHGFWAYTRWYVRWTAGCEVSLEINYTFPKLAKRKKVPLTVRSNWDSMLRKLTAHEENHGGHGISAAREVAEKRCRNAHAIVKQWAAEDKIYDSKTRHGLAEGVRLPD